jgi:eukaryotic-like serine/threonine-protein kinase
VSDRELRARALALFERLVDLDEAERRDLLARESAGEPQLAALVADYLAADDTPSPFLDGDPSDLLDLLADEPGASHQPDAGSLPYGGHIGDYRLLHVAGRGGMAVVYAAERVVGEVRQRVALKLVNRGLDTDDLPRRFRQETKLLASLEHPNIARFHDAGSTADGRPYLVMEYVEGRPLTAFCDEGSLTVAARLDLFRAVCKAVQFAQQRLIVHRDLKPSNILVTTRGEVKLLDFGIAKLLTSEPDTGEALTRTGVRVLTPEYAAPEQLGGDPISTASDVYSLGRLLSELLVGRQPAAVEPAGQVASPGTLLRNAMRDGTAEELARARGTTPDRLHRRIAGDLDRIVLMALEPDPARRYGSAEQLLDDLERHRSGMPVRARPNTVLYRLMKYTRRHRAAVSAVVMAGIMLAGFGGFHAVRITAERDRAQAEAVKAQATTQFLQRLLGDAYPSASLGDAFSMSELLSRATARVDSLADQPKVQAELLRTLGDIYREQGHFREALPLLERAVALHRSMGRTPDRAAGQALGALGHLHYEVKDFRAALDAHRESLQLYRRLLADDDSLPLFALNNIAAAATALGEYDAARSAYAEVLARRNRLFTDTSQLVHVTHNNLGHLYEELGDDAAAEVEFRAALALRRLALPPDHPSTALTATNLGSLLARQGHIEEAEQLHRQAFESFERVFGPDHHRVGLSAFHYGSLLQRMGRLAEAEAMLRRTVAIDRATYGPDHIEIATDLRRLGSILVDKGDWDAAIAALLEADAIYASHDIVLSDARRVYVRADLAASLTALGRYEEAEDLLLVVYAQHDAGATLRADAAHRLEDQLVALYTSWGRPADADRYRGLAAAATSSP